MFGMPLSFGSTARSVVLTAVIAGTASGQDRLKSMPGYDQYVRMAPQIMQAIPGRGFGRGGAAPRWSPEGKTVDFTNGGKQFRYDFVTNKVGDVPPTPQQAMPG